LERAVQLFAILQLTVLGLSHVAAPRAWAEFFIELRRRGEAGVLFVGLLSLGFGSIVCSFHSVWTGIPLVLTILGWAHIVKGLIYLVRPSIGLRTLEKVSVERARRFVPVGFGLLLLAALLAFHRFGAGRL